MGGDATRSYLKRLREIAELSGVNFEIMLSEMLTEMSSEVLPLCAEAGTEDKPPDTPVNQDPPEKTASVVGDPPSAVGQQAQPAASCLLLMLRIEEDKYETKAKRMRPHLAGAKQRVQVHTQRTWVVGESEPSESSDVLSIASETKELKKQIASLQSQLARLTTNPGAVKKTTPPVKAQKNSVTERKPQKINVETAAIEMGKQAEKPRSWYCFKCGQDGHIVSCNSEPNPKLVAEKRKLLKETQSKWESQNAVMKEALN
ncbi:zinc finger CCHC domain-containing 12-like protein [Labeo rohita]|uniref:Zinc finger CCHC domain-containing 12-like protein n=1 Tax=Labeo rohita TaxID=84645 RepID=A0A498L3L8_LABRO|nr:zinc finger CCHC domain-containing 12-like protein [Labeo rohita]RXN19642.1 zinc finger CCHC domain-containing 12-like protein [Labeo rohita]